MNLILTIKAFNKISRKAGLVQMNGKVTVIGFIPSEVNAEEPLAGAHEINRNLGGENLLEFSLNGRVFGEIYEVVSVEKIVMGRRVAVSAGLKGS